VALFNYEAYELSGSKISAQVEADTIQIAKRLLAKRKLHVLKVTPVVASSSLSVSFLEKKLTLADLEFLTAELSILLGSGVKIDKGLAILNKGKGNGPTAALVAEIVQNLKNGKSVSNSFNTKYQAFDPLYLNLIAIGESTGQLPQVFEGMAKDLKFQKDLRSKVTQALTYPSIIFFVCVACILFVFNFIVPQMGSIFTDVENIPVYTRALLGLSEWMQNYQLLLFGGLAGLGGLLYSNRHNKGMRQRLSVRLLKMPALGHAIKQVEMIRFSSAMSIMLDSGIKVDVAIGQAIKNVKNIVVKRSLEIAKEKIKKGASVSSSLAQTPIFPDFYISLLEVGEESGNLTRIFSEISSRAKQDFESWTTRMTSLLEPILILVMGGIVGSVVVTMLLSVVSVNDISL
jgi:type II secretory pathway component PulF